jgi:hypothetical protein
MDSKKETQRRNDILQHRLRMYFEKTVTYRDSNDDPDSTDKQEAYEDLLGNVMCIRRSTSVIKFRTSS